MYVPTIIYGILSTQNINKYIDYLALMLISVIWFLFIWLYGVIFGPSVFYLFGPLDSFYRPSSCKKISKELVTMKITHYFINFRWKPENSRCHLPLAVQCSDLTALRTDSPQLQGNTQSILVNVLEGFCPQKQSFVCAVNLHSVITLQNLSNI